MAKIVARSGPLPFNIIRWAHPPKESAATSWAALRQTAAGLMDLSAPSISTIEIAFTDDGRAHLLPDGARKATRSFPADDVQAIQLDNYAAFEGFGEGDRLAGRPVLNDTQSPQSFYDRFNIGKDGKPKKADYQNILGWLGASASFVVFLIVFSVGLNELQEFLLVYRYGLSWDFLCSNCISLQGPSLQDHSYWSGGDSRGASRFIGLSNRLKVFAVPVLSILGAVAVWRGANLGRLRAQRRETCLFHFANQHIVYVVLNDGARIPIAGEYQDYQGALRSLRAAQNAVEQARMTTKAPSRPSDGL